MNTWKALMVFAITASIWSVISIVFGIIVKELFFVTQGVLILVLMAHTIPELRKRAGKGNEGA